MRTRSTRPPATSCHEVDCTVPSREQEAGHVLLVLIGAVASTVDQLGGCEAGLAATAGIATLAALFGFGIGTAHAGATGETIVILSWAWAALVRAPAVWLLVAVTAVVLASAPRFAAATGFTALGLLLALKFGIELQLLPLEALYVSPFALVPQLPQGPGNLGFTALLVGLTVVLTALATRRVRHLDVH